MNWAEISDQINALSATDELKAFLLGAAFASGVRIIRMGIRWLKNVDRGEA